MPRRPEKPESVAVERPKAREQDVKAKRSAFVWLTLFVLFLNSCWAVYHLQFESLPLPVDPDEAGKRGFSEVSALEHVRYLTSLGPHPVGSDALEKGVQYVFAVAEKIKNTAHWEVNVQVDLFHSETTANRLTGGMFKGKTLIYSDLKHVILRILPKYLPEAEDNAILVSSHIDTVFSTEGAGDCSSCVGVMLELARGVSQWAHGFKNGVIFLFNTGEEEGLNGAHSFITQHPWKNTIRFAIDLEAMGIGGKSSIFQGGSVPWPIEIYAHVAKFPSAQILAQDLFHSGAISSATDFQVYQEVGGLSGLDFAYTDLSAVYHTKNDKLKHLKPGSLQHLGDNMLELLIHSASSPHLQKEMQVKTEEGSGQNQAIYFDILGTYMVTYSQRLATMLYNSVIAQTLLIWVTSLLMGGSCGGKLFGLSCLSIVLMWICSISLSAVVALILPMICSSPVPYVANPWLVIGLFGAPAVLGALTGQHFAFQIMTRYLKLAFPKMRPELPTGILENVIKLEAERWLFKAGFIQWLLILIVGNYYKVGSSFIAFAWLVSPAFAYGLMEATLSPVRLPKQLKIVTLIIGLALPVLTSAGMAMRLIAMLIGIVVRSERIPGGRPEWIGSMVVAVLVAVFVCLMLIYLLSYIHLSDAKIPFLFSLCALFMLSLAAVSTGMLPAFTEDIARTVNVVHVVETRGNYEQESSSFISLFSNTPGKLTEEVKNMKDEDFICDSNKTVDFVTFDVKYGCHSIKGSETGWSKSDIPTVRVESDSLKADVRTTQILLDMKVAKRWALAINGQEIKDFTFEADGETVVPLGDKSYSDGWHIIQFSGGSNSPSKFHLNLVWLENPTKQSEAGSPLLLKLRTDVNKITPKVERVMEKLPSWCSFFGKSTSPFTLAFLTTLPVQF